MAKIGVCEVCHMEIVREEYSDYVFEGCSEFCVNTTPEEKAMLTELKPDKFGIWPCNECGCVIEDYYVPNGHCSKCYDKVKLRQAMQMIASLQKDIEKANKEAALWKKESETAYKYNKDLNKWWQFKLDRLKLEYAHNNKFCLPWKKLAKALFRDFKNLRYIINNKKST